MKISKMLNETFECVKINGILRNLSNDEMKIYKRVKNEGKLFKADLSEFDANVATSMVTKGLLRRKKAQQEQGKHGRIYYIARGRKGHLTTKELDEVAPPGKEAESWIKKNKKRFKDRYGAGYEKYLYGKAWNNYNGKKKVNESYYGYGLKDYKIDIDCDDSYTDVKSMVDIITNIHGEINQLLEQAYGSSEDSDSTRKGRFLSATKKIVKILENNDLFTDDNSIGVTFQNNGENIYDIFEKLKDYIYSEAKESGQYYSYYDREIDSDSTWDKISDEPDGDIITQYGDSDDNAEYLNAIMRYCDEAIECIQNSYSSIIGWNGEEDVTPEQQEKVKKELEQAQIKEQQELAKLCEPFAIINRKARLTLDVQRSRDFDDMINSINDMTLRPFDELSEFERIKSIYHKICSEKDTMYSSARERAYDSGDFDQYYDEEINWDATEENMLQDSVSDWMNCIQWFNRTIFDYIVSINEIFEDIINKYSKGKANDMPSGDEFNECVLYETFNPEFDYEEEVLKKLEEIKRNNNWQASSALRSFIRWFAYEFDGVFDDDISSENINELVTCLDQEEQYKCYKKINELYYVDSFKSKPPKKDGSEYDKDM